MTSIRHNGLDPDPLVSPDEGYLDAAREAILAVGWSRTTLTDIARRAGVSRMTLYRRWPDMQTMLADLMTREWGRMVGAATDPGVERGAERGAAGGREQDPLQRISGGVVATVRALRQNELLRRIIDLDPDLLLPYLLDRRGRSQDQVAAALATMIREAQQAGAVRSGDPDLLARSLVLACHGFTLSAHTMAEGRSPSRDADVGRFDTELATLVERFLRP